MLAILLIPAALCYTFGVMVGDTRQGWTVLAAMTIIFVALLATCVVAEQQGAVFVKQGVDHTASALQSGGNMEGKEVRFGIANSALWATATTVRRTLGQCHARLYTDRCRCRCWPFSSGKSSTAASAPDSTGC